MSRVTNYEKTNWQNLPTKNSPVNATNLNHLEQGVKNVTDAVNAIEDLQPATASSLGGVKVGTTLNVSGDGTINVPVATRNRLGAIKVGNNLSIGDDGTLNANDQTYSLPTASASTKGGVKIGSGVNVAGDGTISVPSLQKATASTLGGIKVGRNLSITSDGTLNAADQGGTYELPKASATVLGGIKVGANLYINSDGVLSALGGGGGGGGSSFDGNIPDMEEQFDVIPIFHITDQSFVGRSFTIGYDDELTCVINADGSLTVSGESGDTDPILFWNGSPEGFHTNIFETYYLDEYEEVYFAVSEADSNITSECSIHGHSIWDDGELVTNIAVVNAEDNGVINHQNKVVWEDRSGEYDYSKPEWYKPYISPLMVDTYFKANTVYNDVRVFPRFLIPKNNNKQKYYNNILFEDEDYLLRCISTLGNPKHIIYISNAYGMFYFYPSGYLEIRYITNNIPGEYIDVDVFAMFKNISEFGPIHYKSAPGNTYFVAGFDEKVKGVELILTNVRGDEIAADTGTFDLERNRVEEDFYDKQIWNITLRVYDDHSDIDQLKICPRFVKYIYEHSTQELPIATPSQLGVIKIGDNLTIDDDGTLNADAHPAGIASTSALGLVKIGSRLSIASDGTLSANDQSYTLPTASSSTKGGVQIGDDINVDSGTGKITPNLYTKLTPTMTSYTIPSGEVLESSYNSSSYYGYKAFDNSTSGEWHSAANQVAGEYIGYKFDTPKRVVRAKLNHYNGIMKEFKFQASNDGINWEDISEVITNPSGSAVRTYNLANSKYYKSYRVYVISGYSTAYVGLRELEFYGLVDGLGTKPSDEYTRYVKITPKMTSDTAPTGYTVTYSSRYSSSYNGYRAFDENLASGYEWYGAQNDVVGAWIGIQLPTAEVVKKLSVYNRNNSTPYAMKQFILQGSNDGNSWTDLAICNVSANTQAARFDYDINNSTAYNRYRIYITEGWASNYVSIAEIELYRAEVIPGDYASVDEIEELFQTTPELPQGNSQIGIKQLADYDILIKQYINAKIAELS